MFLIKFHLLFVLAYVIGCCSAARRARFELAVPVISSGFLWADGCADSTYCEVSSCVFFLFLFTGSFCGLGFSVLFLLIAVVDYLMIVWFCACS